jgi:hypothetical protein
VQHKHPCFTPPLSLAALGRGEGFCPSLDFDGLPHPLQAFSRLFATTSQTSENTSSPSQLSTEGRKAYSAVFTQLLTLPYAHRWACLSPKACPRPPFPSFQGLTPWASPSSQKSSASTSLGHVPSDYKDEPHWVHHQPPALLSW